MQETIIRLNNNKGQVILSSVLLVSILILSGFFVFFSQNKAEAAALTSISDVMNQSAPSATSTHTITFTTPTGIPASATVTITFPSGFTKGGVDYTDIDVKDDSVDLSLWNTASGTWWGATTTGSTVLTFTNGSAAVAAGSIIEVQIGNNATASTTGDANFTNPAKSAASGTADIYTISVAGGFGDTGNALVAIIEGVTVSVTVAESLSFGIAAVSSTTCDTYFGVLAGPDSTTTTIPFGSISTANTFNHACQNLSVSTNASSGFAVKVNSNTSLKSGTGALINSGACDGTCDETTTSTWATNTYNGFAYTCLGAECSITASTTYRTFACAGATTTDCLPGGGETSQNVMSHNTPINNSTSTIQYKISLSGTQTAGTYSNTITYVATPTF
jgi:hypothetical protein